MGSRRENGDGGRITALAPASLRSAPDRLRDRRILPIPVAAVGVTR